MIMNIIIVISIHTASAIAIAITVTTIIVNATPKKQDLPQKDDSL